MGEIEIVKNRSEIVFIYDLNDGNPNGDPLDDNKPRIDEETGLNIVTDVRLKRTIRDYLYNFKNEEIFIRELTDENGNVQTGKKRAMDFLKDEKKDLNALSFEEQKRIISNKVLTNCIDVRLFGATIPLELKVKKPAKNPDTEKSKDKEKTEKGSLTFTGPVQFKIGRSLHRVSMKHFRGKGAFASDDKSTRATFREEDFLPYSLILFYGIINENAAKHTGLKDDDVTLLLDGIWNGTKSLITRTKVGQVPRLLLKVNYSKENYHIGDLDKMLNLVTDIPHENIRGTDHFKIDVSDLVKKLITEKGAIKDIEICADDRIKFCIDGKDFLMNGLEKTTEIPVRQIAF
jgi:CRISPR-associated protein Csh2